MNENYKKIEHFRNLLDKQKGALLFLVIIIHLLITSCIDPYFVELGGSKNKYVVYGNLSDQEGYQNISVSISSLVSEPKFKPLNHCSVEIIDSLGNHFTLSEYADGEYRVWMSKDDLKVGHSYCAKVVTEDGVEIRSDFDKLPQSPEIDSIYYIRENQITSDPNSPIEGIQFYVDVDRSNTNSHYYRWDIIETWEHHAKFPKTYYWNGKALNYFNPPDYSKMICWTTQNVGTIFTLSTYGLITNKFLKHKLYFVSNKTQRLTYCYSLLVTQYTLSKSTYDYWEKLRINSNEDKGLYETQPLHIKGNLQCVSNPVIDVLGLFSTSSLRAKRYFIQNVPELSVLYPECIYYKPLQDKLNRDTPCYLMLFDGGLIPGDLSVLHDDCVLCDFYSGSNKKPDFWPY